MEDTTPLVDRRITVAIPAYNEDAILDANARRLVTFLEERRVDYQVLIGSNGSTDGTIAVGCALQRENGRIEFFHLPNRGVGHAFREFLRRAKHPVLISMDMDLSVDLSFIAEAASLIGTYDIVVGSKKLASQRRSAFRKAGSDFFLWCVRALIGLPYDDYSIGAKAYNLTFVREHADAIDGGSSYVLDLCFAAAEKRRPIACVPVDCEDHRTSKFNLPREAVYKFGHLFKLWQLKRRQAVRYEAGRHVESTVMAGKSN